MQTQSVIENSNVVRNALKRVTSKTPEGFPLVGWTIWWSISGIENLAQSEVAQRLMDVGLPADLAREVRTRSALIRAVKEEAKARGVGAKNKRFHKNVLDSNERAGFGIFATDIQDEEKLDLTVNTETKAILNKSTKSVQFEGLNSDVLKQRFENAKDTYTNERFRQVVLRVLRQYGDAVTVRDSGGIYFIPAHREDIFNKLKELFTKFPGCVLNVIPVIDTATARQSMWSNALDGLKKELAEVLQEIDELPSNASEKMLNNRLEKVEKLSEKVEHYELLLTASAEDIGKTMAEAKRKLAVRLSE